MKLLAIVPARGGSKRLPGKNTTQLKGKPLMWHTLDAVKEHADNLVITSDCPNIRHLGFTWVNNNKNIIKNAVIHERPQELATDTSTVLETVCHIVEEYPDYDVVGLFLPTAPMRNSEDVKQALDLLENSDADGIISTTHFEFPPTLALVMDPDGLLHCADKSLPFITGNTRSQDHTECFRPNGAIYLKRMEAFKRDQNFFKGRVLSYFMPRERSADIDTKADLKMAEFLWKN